MPKTRHPLSDFLKHRAAWLLSLGLLSCMGSESAAQSKIQVLMKNGETWTQDLPGVRKMVFQAPNLVFSLADGQTKSILHADVRRITFEVPTGAGAAKAAKASSVSARSLEVRNVPGEGVALDLSLPGRSALLLEVLSLDGARIRTLADGLFASGKHALTWDGRDNSGRIVEPGTFLVVATSAGDGDAITRKILWLR